MKLGFEEEQTPYSSGAQSARFWTESWVRAQAYCPNCGCSNIDKYENNRPVADFYCGSCGEEYELKSQKAKIGRRIVNGAFRTMCERLAASNNPNLMLMNYELSSKSVRDLFVIPKHFFVPEIIEKRTPLALTARRAGWVGCNILIGQVPEAGRIYFVKDGLELPKIEVLQKWRRTLFLRDEQSDARGWLIEVLRCVESIGKIEFDLSDIYAFEQHLGAIYPKNRHVRQKIRQQMQKLRDEGFLEFVGRGSYRLRAHAG
jgi:type II restriction enzyme